MFTLNLFGTLLFYSSPVPYGGGAPQGALHVTVCKDSKGNYANEVSFIFFKLFFFKLS